MTGYLIVRDVLSEEEIAEANEALDYAKKDIFQHGAGDPHNPVVAYRHQNGAGHCNGVTVICTEDGAVQIER